MREPAQALVAPVSMAREWFVIDTRINQIVNCVTTIRTPEEIQAQGIYKEPWFTFTEQPSPELLDGYQFFRERP